MHRIPETWTIAQLRNFEACNPHLPQWGSRSTCSDYGQFIDILYRDISAICIDLEKNANRLTNDSEDRLNYQICAELKRFGYGVTHDENHRGHADIVVTYTNFTWIGEGKKLSSVNNSYLKKGYDQLVHRYVTGGLGASEAGLITYIYAKDAEHVMRQWGQYLSDLATIDDDYSPHIELCHAPSNRHFYSTVKHPASGSTLKIKHLGISLFFAPPKK